MNTSDFGLNAKSVLFYKAINKTKFLINSIPEIMIMVKHDTLVNGINAISFGQ